MLENTYTEFLQDTHQLEQTQTPLAEIVAPLPAASRLSCSLDSVAEVAEYVNAHKENTFQALMSVTKGALDTTFVMHRSVSDLMQLIGAGAAFQSLTDSEMSKIIKLYKWNRSTIQKNERRLTNLSAGTFTTLPTFENAFDFADMINRRGHFALNARMGTGKTHHVGKPFCDAARELGYTPIVVAHRVALINELSSATNTINYELVKSGKYDDDAVKNGMSLCINSINNKTIQNIINKTSGKYVLFIDEYNQTMMNFDSSTFAKNEAPEALHTLLQLIKNAQAVIIADADINDYSRHIAEAVRGQTAEAYFVDKDNIGVKFNITLQHGKSYDNINNQFGQIYDHLTSGKRAVFCSNRSKICQCAAASVHYALHSYITDVLPDLPVLLICNETENDERVKAFKLNSNVEAEKYALIIISPTITSGVSVTHPAFTTSFSAFDGSTITHLEAIQQLHRFRCVTTHNVVLMTQRAQTETILSIAEMQGALGYSDREMGAGDNFNKLLIRVKRDKKDSKESFAKFFVSRLTDLGYRVQINDELNFSSTFDTQHYIELINDEYKCKILKAKKISYSKYNKLKQQDVLTETEKFEVIHFDVRTALNMPDNKILDLPLLELFGNKGRGISTIRRNAITFSAIDFERMEANEINHEFPLNKRRFALRTNNLANRYLEAAFGEPVTLSRLMNLSAPLAFSNSTLGAFASLVDETAILGITAKIISSKRASPDFRDKSKIAVKINEIEERGRAKVATDFLSRIGLKFTTTSRTQREGKNENVYTLDIENLMQMYEVLCWQADKTKEIEKARQAKADALKQNKSEREKTIDELDADELEKLDNIVNATISEYDSVEAGSYNYSCEKCYTPTNKYTCACCGHSQLSSLFNIHAINRAEIRESIFLAHMNVIVK